MNSNSFSWWQNVQYIFFKCAFSNFSDLTLLFKPFCTNIKMRNVCFQIAHILKKKTILFSFPYLYSLLFPYPFPQYLSPFKILYLLHQSLHLITNRSKIYCNPDWWDFTKWIVSKKVGWKNIKHWLKCREYGKWDGI